MAEYTINKLEKIIKPDTPIVGIDGQYNYGNVDSDEYIRIMGTMENNIINNESDLYTYVIHKQDSNLSDNPNGLLWQTLGSKIQITYCDVHDNRYYKNEVDSYNNEYHNVKVAFYIFDSATVSGSIIEDVFNDGKRDTRSNGNKIRDAIGIGNDVLKSPYLIGYYNEKNYTEKSRLGDVIEKWKTGEYMGDVSVKDFPRFANPGNSAVFFGGNGLETTTQVFNTDIEKFHNQVIGKEDGSIYIVVRTCGDERDKRPTSTGRNDKLDRSYTVIKIPKIELFELWTGIVSSKELIAKSSPQESGTGNPPSNSKGNHLVLKHFRDNYGDGRGYKNWGDNKRKPLYTVDEIKIQLTGPNGSISPITAIKPKVDGGINANWVKKDRDGWHAGHPDFIDNTTGERIGLNPIYDIDFLGNSNIFYKNTIQINNDFESNNSIWVLESTQTDENRNYFSGSLITQNNFRPISYISSSFDVDCQSYYNDDRESGFYLNNIISAPNIFKLQFKLSEKSSDVNENTNIFYIDPIFVAGVQPFSYYFFVVNWNWNDDDLGGGKCEENNTCLEEIGYDFPKSLDELGELQQSPSNLYELKTIGPEVPEDATHTYNEPGLKIIKAVVFSTINKDSSSTIYGSNYNNHVQAVMWKLVTIRLNVTEDRAVTSDFFDVGGGDFTYLPYPDVVDLDETIHQGKYKSSHPVISGLSADSVYVNGLNKIIKMDKFGKNELFEKIDAKKSLANSPGKKLDEYGNFFGKSDISQIRYFNTVSDMKTLLGITVVETSGGDYNPHSSDYWSCSHWNEDRSDCFDESPVGDIFISEYDQFRESCLFELNLDELDGKTIKDTSGGGNKGILIGDYSIKKNKINKKSTRDSFMKISKIQKKNGAF